MNLKKIIIELAIIAFIFPLIILGIWSVTGSWIYPSLLPQSYSLRGFQYILSLDNIAILINSIVLSILVVFINIVISIPAAKALSLYNFKGKKFFELLVLSPVIIPIISIAMGVHIFFIKLKLANTYLGVVIINILPCIPYAVRIISDVYKLVGDKLEIQAKMLGASNINVFRYVTLPLLLPGILGASSMCFIIVFSQYFLTMLIGGGTVITYPMIMFPYIQSGDRVIGAMYSIVFLVASIIVLILIEKRIKIYYKNSSSFFEI